ncbi:DNA internalization-related competence protein ComEC/Rec2 [Marinobacter sp. VGCF2001]|uniref:DNA internalization-related competence protein ComEC/Rec2 n=1 Tax=Marinobacter sp. VGCF2001 TaxID=3417189 RepID=UPI003CF6A76B
MSEKTATGQLAIKRIVDVASILAFSCGVILLYRLATLPPYPWLFVASLVVVMLSLRRRWRGRRVLSMFAAALFGLAWAGWHADSRLVERLPASAEGQRLLVSGYLCNLPAPGSFDSVRFGFCVSKWHSPGLSDEPSLPRHLRLSWYGREGRTLPDHRLMLEVVLKRPHGNLNSEGFRYENWLFRHGYRATGSVKQVSAAPQLECGVRCQYHAWHWRTSQRLNRMFGAAEHYPLIASLLMGDRSHLNDTHWQALKATGTIHLVAISGLHLGLVAVGVGLLARWALLLPAGRLSERSRRSLVFAFVVTGCASYSLLAGFTVPTQRALVMVTAGSWYLLKAQQQSGWLPFALALATVLLMDPFAPLDQGFWLSFGAVAVLMFVFYGRLGATGWLSALVRAQLAVFVGLWPMLMVLNQGQPVAGMLANLVAVPWVSFAVMPVLFVGSMLALLFGDGLLPWVMVGFDRVLGVLWWWLQWIAEVRLGQMRLLPLPLAAGLALLALWAIRWRDWRWRVLFGMTMLVSIPDWQGAGPSNDMAEVPEVRILDVGQGLSVVVRSGSKVMVYDTGPAVPGVYSAAESVLIPNLRAMGIEVIDLLVLSHGDNDHAGGLEQLAEAFEITRVITGEPEAARDRVSASVAACQPDTVRWPDLELSFWRTPLPASGNDASCVLRLYHEQTDSDIILAGDISRRVEQFMIGAEGPGWNRTGLAHRVVLAPHHGSKTSSSPEWIQAMMPDQVIYTAGYRHHFGHPHPDVTRRYRSAGALALNTACSGQIQLSFMRGQILTRELWRSQPFWIASPEGTRSQCQ